MPIFLKISFVSQSTQNLSAALRILNVNPGSTAASLFVEGNSAIISDMHTLFCHVLYFCYILWQFCYVLPVQSSRKEPLNSQLNREHFFRGGFILDFVEKHTGLMSMTQHLELAPSHQSRAVQSALCRAEMWCLLKAEASKGTSCYPAVPCSASPLPLLFPGSEPPSLFPKVFATTQVPPLAP